MAKPAESDAGLEPQPVELTTPVKPTVGRPKCGMPWKKSSKRSKFSSNRAKMTYEKRMEEKKRMESVKARVA